MTEFAVTRSIGAPIDRVWNVLADVERWHEWTRSILSVERLDPGPLGVGSRCRVRQPKLRPAVLTVTEWAPERGFTWVARVPGVQFTGEHVLRPEARGCAVELRVRYGGLLGGLVGVVYRRLTERYIQQEAEGLRARSEGDA